MLGLRTVNNCGLQCREICNPDVLLRGVRKSLITCTSTHKMVLGLSNSFEPNLRHQCLFTTKEYYGEEVLPKISKTSSLDEPIQLIATDVDGTLLDGNQILTERAVEAINKASERGIQVVIATGKAKGPWVSKVFPRLNLKTPAIFLQGLLIYDHNWTLLYENKMDDSVALRVIEAAKEWGLSHMIYSGERILCEKTDQHTDRMIGYGEPIPEPMGPLEEVIGKVPVHKLLFAAEDTILASIRPELEFRLGENATIVTALNGFLEVLPPKASKGKGIAYVLDRLGIDPKHMMAIGDGENDIEMLEMAGKSVAMGNAVPKLKNIANFVTRTHHDEGFALAVERLVLGMD